MYRDVWPKHRKAAGSATRRGKAVQEADDKHGKVEKRRKVQGTRRQQGTAGA
jgi:hypothetical protein